MPTTLVADQGHLAHMLAAQPAAHAGQGLGAIVYAGTLWPQEDTPAGKQNKHDIDYALGEARTLIARGVTTASAALRGDEVAVGIMTTWFGARPVGAHDWWRGVYQILAVLESNLVHTINVYYRNSDTLGRWDDYPNVHRQIAARDVQGYAETVANAGNLQIGLCEDFFAQRHHNARVVNRTGFDSVGGILVHELSHNICGTDDHELNDGRAAYGARARTLAGQAPQRAWYNADNIEYFCEEAAYVRR
jgi:hypothetical protein